MPSDPQSRSLPEPFRGLLSVLLNAALGALSVLAFAPFGLFWLLPPLLALALHSWTAPPPRTAALRGYAYGLGLFGCGVHWVYVSVHRYGGVPPAGAVAITALLVAWLALFPAVSAWLLARLRPGRSAAALLLVFPAAWLVGEGLRGWVLTGFPWLAAGYSQIDGPLAGLAPFGGVHLVSLAVALSAGALLWLVGPRARASRLAVAAGLVLLWGGSALLGRIDWGSDAGPPLRVALVQGNVSQLVKWDPGHLGATLARYERLSAPHWTDADLLVWPENALPLFVQRLPPDYVERLRTMARRHDTAFLTGVPRLDVETGRYYNALVRLDHSGPAYDKRHLVPFGEYIPLQVVLGGLLDWLQVPLSAFSLGAPRQPLLQVKGQPIGSSICYEIVLGAQVARDLPQATLLLNVSNDAWFGDTIAAHQHLEIARMRTRETARALVRATNTGITAVIDSRARVQARLPQFEPGVLRATVQPREGATPYVHWRDAPVWGLVLAMAVAGLLLGRRRRQRL